MKRPLAILTGLVVVAGGVLCSTPAADAATPSAPARALWVNDTLRVTYSGVMPPLPADDASMVVSVDGKWIDEQEGVDFTDRTITVPRAASAGPAHVEVISEAYVDDSEGGHDVPTTVYSATVQRHVVQATKGQVSAATLLNRLTVAKESHAGSFARSRFTFWTDADHDGENTRAEVLRAESKKRVSENGHHTVQKGRWTSPFDGVTTTVASEVAVDQLVPLEEAWTSGAYSWSVRKRTAYANDLGYAASLVAVSKRANRARGDKEPDAYLPSNTSDVCAYVRDSIAVKARWGLTIDPAEKTALKADLALDCIDPYVGKPGRPDVAALVGPSAPKADHVSGSGSSTVSYTNCAAVRAAGKAPLLAGQPGYATPRLDRDGDGVACE